MKDEFDKRLSDHITEVFDNFEDNSADAGWELLREKYPVKKKRRVIWLWIGSAAAILLLLLGIGIWSGDYHQKSGKLVVKTQGNPKVSADSMSSHANQNNLAATQSKTVNQTPSPQTNHPSPVKSQQAAHLATINSMPVVPKKTTPVLSGRSASTIAANKNTVVQQAPDVVNEPTKSTSGQNNEPQKAVTNTTVAANSASTTNSTMDTAAKKNIAQNETKPVNPIVKSPFTENDPVIKKSKSIKQADNSNPVTFGVYAATYLNYASGSNSQMNVGAGVASDIHLAKNLKLSTGVAVNQNSLSFGNRIPNSSGLVAATAGFYNVNVNAPASYSIPVLKSYNAQLTSLDVPLDLKYEFNPEKNGSFISLGLSSGTFITETYNSQYGYTNSTAQTQSSSTNSFSGFSIAKTLDFSFGLGYPIGKNRLSIEPFVRYPLQGLGADQIKFGASGVNLKFNFSNNKK